MTLICWRSASGLLRSASMTTNIIFAHKNIHFVVIKLTFYVLYHTTNIHFIILRSTSEVLRSASMASINNFLLKNISLRWNKNSHFMSFAIQQITISKLCNFKVGLNGLTKLLFNLKIFHFVEIKIHILCPLPYNK